MISVGRSNEVNTDSMLRFCITMLHSIEDLQLAYDTTLNIDFSVVLHCASGVGGLTLGTSEVPRYRLVTKAVDTAMELLDRSRPSCILISEACGRTIKDKNNKSFIELSEKHIDIGTNGLVYRLAHM